MNLTMHNGHLATTKAASNSTMFFAKVCPLVSRMASPKQPQSFTGLAKYIHTVMSVIMPIKPNSSFETKRRCMAKSR